MAHDRRRAREARQEARRHELEAAAARRERIARRQALTSKLTPSGPHRRRRYGALSTRALVSLVLVYLVGQVAIWVIVPDLGARLALAVLTLAALDVLVLTRRRPPR